MAGWAGACYYVAAPSLLGSALYYAALLAEIFRGQII